jgi:RNA polymerase primary sigma factor
MRVNELEVLEERELDVVELDADAEERTGRGSLRGIESDDVISMYMREVGTIPLLSAEDERELGLTLREGKTAQVLLTKGGLSPRQRERLEQKVREGERARARFIEANSRLVISIARKYLGRGLPLSDLMQEGNLGLIKAVERFDPERGHRFSTYATWWIRQAVLRAVADQGRTIRLPAHIVDELNRVHRARKQLAQELGREATDDELAEELEVPAERVRDLLHVAGQPLSLETPVGEEEESTLA